MVELMSEQQLTTERLQDKLEANERFYKQELRHLEELIKSFNENVERRFYGVNGFKETFIEQSRTMMSRPEAENKFQNITERFDTTIAAFSTRYESDLKAVATKQESDLRPIQALLNDMGRTNWTRVLTAIGIAGGAVSGVWLVINLNISLAISPLKSNIDQINGTAESYQRQIVAVRAQATQDDQDLSALKQDMASVKTSLAQVDDRLRHVEELATSSASVDAQSRTDRAQLNDRARSLEDKFASGIAERRATEAAVKSSLSELESQLCSTDVVRNLMHANDLRVMSILWQRSKMGDYPINNAYYPSICNKGLYPNQIDPSTK